jgi:hypothetical protein
MKGNDDVLPVAEVTKLDTEFPLAGDGREIEVGGWISGLQNHKFLV